MNNGVPLVLGTRGANRVNLLRPSAGVMRIIGVGGTNNEGIDINVDSTANVVEFLSTTGAGFKFSPTQAADHAASIVLGDGLDPDGTSNWWLGWAPGTLTVNLAGDWFDVLFSAGANVDLAGNAMGTVATMSLSEPGITLSGGSVVTACTLFIANAPTEGTTNNNALRVGSGLASFDDFEVRTGGTVGFFGTAPVAQQTLTDSTGGATNGDLAAVAGSGADATINDNFAEIRAILNAYGLV